MVRREGAASPATNDDEVIGFPARRSKILDSDEDDQDDEPMDEGAAEDEGEDICLLFEPPLDDADLVDDGKDLREARYRVVEECPRDDILLRIEQFSQDAFEMGQVSLVKPEHFAAFFAAVREFDDLVPQQRQDVWRALFKCAKKMSEELSNYLEKLEKRGGHVEDAANHRMRLNAATMIVYLIARFVNKTAQKFITILETATHPLTGRGRKQNEASAAMKVKAEAELRKAMATVMPNDWAWDSQRLKAAEGLARFLRTKGREKGVESMWPAGVNKDAFTNATVALLEKLLEEPGLRGGDKTKNQPYRRELGELFSVLLHDFGRGEALASSQLSTLQSAEGADVLLNHVVGEVLERAEALPDDDDRRGQGRTFVGFLLKTIGSLDAEDLKKEGRTAQYGKIIVVLAKRSPNAFVAMAHHVGTFLNNDPYNLRMAVLEAYVEVVTALYSPNTELSEQQLQKRDTFLSRIDAHLHDINATVRAACIKNWKTLYVEDRLPINMLETLLPRIAARMSDKAPSVRKEALFFLRNFLSHNLYSDELKSTELEANLRAKEEELSALRNDEAQNTPKGKAELRWEHKEATIREMIIPIVKRFFPINDGNAGNRNGLRRMEKEAAKAAEAAEAATQPAENAEAMDVDGESQPAAAEANGTDDWDRFTRKIGIRLRKGEAGEEWDGTVREEDMIMAMKALHNLRKKQPTCTLFDDWAADDDLPTAVDRTLGALHEIYILPFLPDTDAAADVAQGPPEAADVSQNPAEAENDKATTIANLRAQVKFLKAAFWFSTVIQGVLVNVKKLFKSQQSSDVTEAIEFVVVCKQFKIVGADSGVRRLSGLIWRKDEGVRKAVVDAFKRLYIDSAIAPPPEDGDAAVNAPDYIDTAPRDVDADKLVCKSLMNLVADADSSELASLEEVIGALRQARHLPSEVVQLFWTYADPAHIPPNASRKTINSALKLIAMAAKADRSVILEKMNFLLFEAEAVWARALADFDFGFHICDIIEKIGQKIDLKEQASVEKVHYRFSVTNADGTLFPLFRYLSALVEEGFGRTEEDNWSPMMEKAMNVLFHLAESPEDLAQRWLRSAAAQLRGAAEGDADRRSRLLVRFFALVGHFALRLLVHVDVAYTGELKRRHLLLEKERVRTGKHNRRRSKSKAPTNSRLSHLKDANESLDNSRDDNDEDILGNSGAVEDGQNERINDIIENQILLEGKPLHSSAQFVVHFLRRENWWKATPAALIAAAAAFSKLMLVSRRFCAEGNNLRLFFTLLGDKSLPAAIRTTLMIASGDLSIRFPNLVEPYKQHLYERLQDTDRSVEQTCMLVLTHLILNDMVQPKGYVASIAVKMDDDANPAMAGLARTFFDELAQKGDKVNRHMADIISSLSNMPACQEDPLKFQRIMKILIKYVKSETQITGQVQQFCQRFNASLSDAQAENFAFCLAQFPTYIGDALTKLMSGLDGSTSTAEGYSQFLRIKPVFDYISNALKAARTHAKNAERLEEINLFIENVEKRAEQGGDVTEDTRRETRKSLESKRSDASAAKRGGGRGRGRKRPSPNKIPTRLRLPKRRPASDESDGDDDAAASDGDSDLELE